MDQYLDEFINLLFSQDLEISLDIRNTIRYTLLPILYSHRFDRNDKYIQEIRSFGFTINFDVIRNVMYRYSDVAVSTLLDTSITIIVIW